MGALALTVVSIAFFNFAGVSITRELGATNRKVLDSLRTLVIWAFSLIIGWQLFYWLQVRKSLYLKRRRYIVAISCNNHFLNKILNWTIIFQPVGFVILVLGMFVYNDMIFLPLIRKHTTWIPEGW